MDRKFSKKVMVNGKHSHSEMSAGASYKNYHKRIRKFFANVNPFNKINK